MIFTKPKKDKRTELEKTIDDQLAFMVETAQSVEELNEILSIAERRSKPKEKKFTVSPDTIVTVAGSLLGIALIIGHEQLNVITTKALGFVIKGRV